MRVARPRRSARRAGVSSFGISGTNAHVILEEPPAVPSNLKLDPDPSRLVPWVVSAKSASALTDQALRLRRFIEQRPDLDPTDVALWLVSTRASFDHRAVAVGAGREELSSGLAAIGAGAPAPNVAVGKAADTGRTEFVFPGQELAVAGHGGRTARLRNRVRR